MSYLVFAFLAAISFSLNNLISKFASKHAITDHKSLTAFFFISNYIFALLLLPFIPKSIPDISILKLTSTAAITYFIGFYFFFRGITTTDASSFAPLWQLQTGFTALLAFLFLHEIFPLSNYLWIGIIILGAVLVTIEENLKLSSFLKPGVVSIIASQPILSITAIIIGSAVKKIDPIQALFWEFTFLGSPLLLFLIMFRPKLNYPLKSILTISVASFFNFIGVLSILKAFEVNVTISSTIALLNAPIILVISIIASKFYPDLLEHHSAQVYLIRSFGVLLTILGAYQIAIS